MKVQAVLDWIDSFAPFDSAEGFDNSGLQMGDPQSELTGVLFALDATEDVLAEAVRRGMNLVVTHHPLLFHAVKQIRFDSPLGRIFRLAFENGISIISAHTNWDKAPGGIGDTLAERIGLTRVRGLDDYVRIGELPEPMTPDTFEKYVSEKLNVQLHQYGEKPTIRTVAVAGGSYGEGTVPAAEAGADAFISGELKHHELLEGTARGMVLVCGEHYATEFPGLAKLKERFEAFSEGIPVELFTIPPFPGAAL